MAIKQTLQESKDKLDALLAYANGTTGQADVSIGDAIKTLCDGYGGSAKDDTLKQLLEQTLDVWDDPNITKINFGLLRQNNKPPRVIRLVNCKSIAAEFLYSANTVLQELYLPSLTSVGTRLCFAQNGVKNLVFENATTVGQQAFAQCTGLEKIDFHKLVSFSYNGQFSRCTKLEALIMRGNAVVRGFSSTACIDSTAISAGNGYIYVNSALVDAYKADSAWGVYADQIRAIEDYPDITGGAIV